MPRLNTPAYQWLEDVLSQVRREIYTHAIFSGILTATGVILASILALLLLDNAVHFSPEVRLVLTPAWAVMALGALGWVGIRPMLSRPTLDDAALAVQRRFPEMGERPINAIQVCRAGRTSVFVDALVDESARAMQPLDFSLVPDRRRLLRCGSFAGAMFALVLAYASAFQPYFANAALRYLHPSKEIGRVGVPELMVEPGDTAVTVGETINVRARVLGASADTAELLWRSGGDDWQTCPMASAGEAFRYQFDDVRVPFVYRVRAGKGISEKFQVKVLPALGISRIGLRYDYPAYTRLSPKTVGDSDGRVEALAGTRVELQLHPSRPVRSASVILESLERVPLRVAGTQDLSGGFTVAKSGNYSVEMVGVTGDRSASPVTYPVTVIPDTPPRVELATSVPMTSVAPSDTVPLSIRAKDDFGVGRIVLKVRVDENAWREIKPWTFDPPADSSTLDYDLELSGLSLQPGMSLSLIAEGTDLNDVTGPGVGSSQTLVLEVKRPDAVAEDKKEEMETGLDSLAKLVQRQKDNLDQTRDIGTRLTPEGALAGSDRARLSSVRKDQAEIRVGALTLSKALGSSHPAAPLTLDALATQEMIEATRSLESAEGADDKTRKGHIDESVHWEQTILTKLQDLLDHLAYEQQAVRIQDVIQALQGIQKEQTRIRDLTGAEGSALPDLARAEGELRAPMKAVESMLKKLEGNLRPVAPALARAVGQIAETTEQQRVPADIVQAQSFLQETRRDRAIDSESDVLRKVTATLESLVKALLENSQNEKEDMAKALEETARKAEKLANLEKNVLEAIEATNKLDEDKLGDVKNKKLEKLAEFQKLAAQAAATTAEDLKKLPKAPFTGDMVKEFASVTEKLNMTSDMLQKAEAKEVCREMTKELMEKLMKVAKESKDGQAMLDTAPDMTKWNLKDIPEGQMPEIPLGKLPDKLTDMVGELIDKQEDQNDKTNDKSSNWAQADSKAGVPKEGPISSFGGKGKTGNHRPDPTEVDGRGGAGRSGQTSGEMIEGATKNLDGDPTPERRTPDPVQENSETIQDNDPKPGNATGGGKKGGAGGEGMPGRPDDVFEKDLDELAEKQDSLRTSAEQLETALRGMNLPTWTLPEAVRLMEASGSDLRALNITEAQEKQKLAVQALRLAYQAMKGKPYVQTENGQPLPPGMKREILQSRSESFPAAYKDLLQRYYQEISDQAVNPK